MSKVGPLADAKAQRDMRRAEREGRTEAMQRLYAVLSTEQGRAFYWSLMHEVCGLSASSWDDYSEDGYRAALNSAYTEGRRWVGRTLMAEAQDAFPDFYRQMLNERLARAQAEAERQDREQAASQHGDDDDG